MWSANTLTQKYPGISFVAPFAAFIILLGIRSSFSLNPQWEYPAQVVVVSLIVVLLSLPVILWRLIRPLGSIAIGVTVFLIWIGPDLLWPGYRHHWLFENSLMGSATSSLGPEMRSADTF